MKSFFHFLKAIPLALAFFLFMPEAQATHYMGVDITYSCLPGGNGCTYRVFHNTYYDCAGAATTPLPGPPFPPTISFQPTTCQQPNAVGAWQFVSYVEVTPICVQAATQCTQNGATINGVLEARFYRDYNFCNVNCTVYNITWGTCCRNGSITSGAANDGIYSGNTQINLGFTPCNSSPQFSTPPVPYVCAGSPFTFNQGAFDPDGDSLVYVLSPCQDNATTQVGYAGGFSPTQPLGPSWNVTLNSATGDITITPNPGNVLTGVLCVTVEEYRNGVKIGEVTRDIQVTVINCGSNSPPTLGPLTNVQGAVQTAPYTLNVCPNNPVAFDISGTDPDPNDSLLLFWNVVTAPMGATFTAAGNTAITDTARGSVTTPPVGRFTWTPTTPGLYNVTLTIQDNGCPLFTSNQITVVIDVSNAQLAPTISTRKVGCYDIEFTVDAGGGCPPFDLTFDPGDNTGPITTQITSAIWTYVHSYPAIPTPNTYGFSASFVDFGLNTAIAQGNVTISNTAIANAGPDLALCPGQSGVIGTGAQPGHTYQWRGLTTNLGLPNGAGRTNARPPVSLNNTTNSPISIDYEVTAIDSVGCVSLDTVNVSYNPKPAPTFTATPEVCQGEAATVTYTGIRRPGTTYNWNFGTGTSTSGTIGVGPHNVFWSPPISGLQTIILTTTVNGCTSDAVSQVVEVKSIPTSGFTVISPICEGQASILTYTGNSGPSATAIWDLDGGNVVAGDINGLDPLTVTWNTPGPKIITLTVDDRNCIGPTVVDTVVVNPIPSSDFSNPVSLCQGDSAQFVYLGNADNTAAYTWDFAGGGSNPATASQGPYNVSWSTPGVKRVCLNVQDKGCFSPQTCKNVQVYETPQARIDPVSDVCFAGGANSVAFTYSGTPGVSTYNWDFGFGSTPRTSNVANPANIRYLSTGVKTVSLVVANNGCISDTFTTTFEVIPEPKADFIVNSNSTICSNDSITFTLTAPAVGPGQTYFWRFGNNASPATSSLPNPGGVTYTSGGVKTISLVADYRGCRDVKATQLRVEESPMLSAGQSIEFCEGSGGAQINATTTGGTPTYTYLWRCSAPSCGLSSNIVEDPFVNPLAFAPQTIQYYGQAVDAKGCRSNIDTVDVTVHPKPKVDAGRDTVMCEGGIGVTLKGSLAFNNRAAGPFSYQWTDDRGNFPPNGMVPPNDKRLDPYTAPDQTTIYTLVVTDLTTGCDSRTTTVDPLSTVEVQVIPQPVAHAGPDTVMCFGDFINLNGYGSGGDGTYTYAWSPTNTGFINSPTRKDPTISPQQTTTYTLVVTSEGCESDGDQVEVTVYAEPTADAGDEKDICLGDTVTLDGRVSGDLNDPAYSFVWVPATGLNDPMLEKPDASPQTTTLYKLIATSDYGCGADTSEVTVTVNSTPIVEATSVDTVICKGDEIQLSAQHSFITTAPGGPVIYLWTPASTVVDGIFSQTPTVKPNLTTLYKVKASIGNCSTTDEVLVTVIPGVEAGVTATDSTICAGDVTTLTATGGIGDAKFYWTPGLSLNDSLTAEVAASPEVTTTYNLRVEEGLCADDTSITITVYPTPSSDYLHSIPEGCEGLEVNFMENTTDAVSFIWDFGDGTPLSNEANPNHVYDQPGEYPVSLTAIGAFGCESTTQKATIRVSEGSFADFTSTPNSDTEVPLPDATVAFEDLSANAVSWLWDFGDGSSSSEQNPTHTYQSPLDPADPSKGYDVTLTVTDANGCKSSITYGPYLIINPDLFVPNVFTPNGDGINDEFLVIYNGSENYQLTVFNRWGARIFQSDVPGEPWLGQTNNGNMATEGVYYYTVQIGNKTHKGNISLLR